MLCYPPPILPSSAAPPTGLFLCHRPNSPHHWRLPCPPPPPPPTWPPVFFTCPLISGVLNPCPLPPPVSVCLLCSLAAHQPPPPPPPAHPPTCPLPPPIFPPLPAAGSLTPPPLPACLLTSFPLSPVHLPAPSTSSSACPPVLLSRLAEGSNASSSELRHCVRAPLRKKKHFFFSRSRWSYWQY